VPRDCDLAHHALPLASLCVVTNTMLALATIVETSRDNKKRFFRFCIASSFSIVEIMDDAIASRYRVLT
jgi:hypothetical protein